MAMTPVDEGEPSAWREYMSLPENATARVGRHAYDATRAALTNLLGTKTLAQLFGAEDDYISEEMFVAGLHVALGMNESRLDIVHEIYSNIDVVGAGAISIAQLEDWIRGRPPTKVWWPVGTVSQPRRPPLGRNTEQDSWNIGALRSELQTAADRAGFEVEPLDIQLDDEAQQPPKQGQEYLVACRRPGRKAPEFFYARIRGPSDDLVEAIDRRKIYGRARPPLHAPRSPRAPAPRHRQAPAFHAPGSAQPHRKAPPGPPGYAPGYVPPSGAGRTHYDPFQSIENSLRRDEARLQRYINDSRAGQPRPPPPAPDVEGRRRPASARRAAPVFTPERQDTIDRFQASKAVA